MFLPPPLSPISSYPAGLASIVGSVEDSQAPQRLGGLAIAGDRTAEADYAASVSTGSGILEGGTLGILISGHLSHSGGYSTIGTLPDSAELGVRACEEIPGIGAWSICHAIDGRTYQYAIDSCVETGSSNLPESHVFYKARTLIKQGQLSAAALLERMRRRREICNSCTDPATTFSLVAVAILGSLFALAQLLRVRLWRRKRIAPRHAASNRLSRRN